LTPPEKEILECVAKSELKAHFIEPMLLLRTDKLPEGPSWLHELFSMVIALSPSRLAASYNSGLATTTTSAHGIPPFSRRSRRFLTRRSSTARSSPSIPMADRLSICCKTTAQAALQSTSSCSTF